MKASKKYGTIALCSILFRSFQFSLGFSPDVLKSPNDAFLNIKGKEPEFYIRLNSSSEKLNIMEYNKYKESKLENS